MPAEPEPAAVFARAAVNRRLIADVVEGLDETQLSTPSLCEGWAVRDVVGHLTSLDISLPRFALEVLRDRGRVGRTSTRLARDYGRRPVAELVDVLRTGADHEDAPPGIGPMGPMADTCIHLRDIAIPLGLPETAPLDDWRLVLNFLTTSRARRAGFLPRGRLDGLRLTATDVDWSHGEGEEVSGPAESLALAATGRQAGLPTLDGPGVELLRTRL